MDDATILATWCDIINKGKCQNNYMVQNSNVNARLENIRYNKVPV